MMKTFIQLILIVSLMPNFAFALFPGIPETPRCVCRWLNCKCKPHKSKRNALAQSFSQASLLSENELSQTCNLLDYQIEKNLEALAGSPGTKRQSLEQNVANLRADFDNQCANFDVAKASEDCQALSYQIESTKVKIELANAGPEKAELSKRLFDFGLVANQKCVQ